jgi:hypothetical protein
VLGERIERNLYDLLGTLTKVLVLDPCHELGAGRSEGGMAGEVVDERIRIEEEGLSTPFS